MSSKKYIEDVKRHARWAFFNRLDEAACHFRNPVMQNVWKKEFRECSRPMFLIAVNANTASKAIAKAFEHFRDDRKHEILKVKDHWQVRITAA